LTSNKFGFEREADMTPASRLALLSKFAGTSIGLPDFALRGAS
jgi:hypothetical protein